MRSLCAIAGSHRSAAHKVFTFGQRSGGNRIRRSFTRELFYELFSVSRMDIWFTTGNVGLLLPCIG